MGSFLRWVPCLCRCNQVHYTLNPTLCQHSQCNKHQSTYKQSFYFRHVCVQLLSCHHILHFYKVRVSMARFLWAPIPICWDSQMCSWCSLYTWISFWARTYFFLSDNLPNRSGFEILFSFILMSQLLYHNWFWNIIDYILVYILRSKLPNSLTYLAQYMNEILLMKPLQILMYFQFVQIFKH